MNLPHNFWQKLLARLAQRKLVSAVLLTSGFTLLARAVGALREIYVAYLFGTGDRLDAYLVALVLATFLANTLGGALQSALVPQFMRVAETEGNDPAKRLLAGVGLVLLAALVVLSAVLLLAADPLLRLIAAGFSDEKRELARRLFCVLLPVFALNGLALTVAAILNARGRFALPGWAALANGALTLGVLWAGDADHKIQFLAFGTTCGALAELAILILGLRRMDLLVFPRWHGVSPALQKVAREYWPAAAGCLLMAQAPLVNQAMAAMLTPGAVAALNFGAKAPGLVLAIAAMGLSSALLPHFSGLSTRENPSTVFKNFIFISIRVLGWSLLITVILAAVSDPLTRLLFERGAFTAENSCLASKITLCLSLQIPFYLIGMVGVRLLSAWEMNRWLFNLSALNLAVNILGNLVFMRYWGVIGIALATALVYAVSTTAIVLVLWRKSATTGAETATSPYPSNH